MTGKQPRLLQESKTENELIRKLSSVVEKVSFDVSCRGEVIAEVIKRVCDTHTKFIFPGWEQPTDMRIRTSSHSRVVHGLGC